jgi:hypothetical protein
MLLLYTIKTGLEIKRENPIEYREKQGENDRHEQRTNFH